MSARNPKWLRILFYENGQSLINNKKFFISPNGQFSAEDELAATLKILEPALDKVFGPNEQLPQNVLKFACEFPARFAYLSKILNIEKQQFSCNDFETWKDSFEANGVSLIFASQYLENPASSFGHTFLKINSDKKALYLNKVVSFAAEVPNDVPAYTYIYKGLFGGFDSFFSVYPFYLTFNEYANLERRDLWEYRLKLNQDQSEELLSYIYELVNKGNIDYSFFSKNCAGMILKLLETTLENELFSDLPFYISPQESVKVLSKNNLIEEVIYHPSITSRLNKKSKELTLSESKKIHSFINNGTPLTKEDSVKVLDLGIEYLNFKRQKNAGVFLKEDEVQFKKAISARASKEDDTEIASNEKLLYPEKSSGIQRVSLGLRSQDHSDKIAIAYRPAGKDFFDKPNGFLKESEINILNTKLYFDINNPKHNFFSVDLLGLKKYVDYDVINKNTSWGANLAVKSDHHAKCKSCYFTEVDSFYGLGRSLFERDLLFYLVAHPLIRYGNLTHHYSFIPQVEFGAIFSKEEFVLKSSFIYGYQFSGKENAPYNEISTSVTKIFKKDYAIVLTHNYLRSYSKNIFELQLLYSY